MNEFINNLYRAAGLTSRPQVICIDSHEDFFENYSKYESQLGGIPEPYWAFRSNLSVPVTRDDDLETHVYIGDPLYEDTWNTKFSDIGETIADKIVESTFDEYSDIMDKLDSTAVQSGSQMPLGIEANIFLGCFGWLLSIVSQKNLFLLTFNDLVFVSKM